jgi:hypothetical protein
LVLKYPPAILVNLKKKEIAAWEKFSMAIMAGKTLAGPGP